MPPQPLPTPELTVVAGRPRRGVDWAELWSHRDLLYFLTRRHVVARYKQTIFGVLWAILQPITTMVVFSLFLGRLAGVPSDDIPYPVFAYLGILPWQFFAGTVSRANSSLVGNAHLITQVYFPRVLIPLSTTIAGLVDFAIAFVVLFGIMAWYGVTPAPTIVLVVPLVLLIAVIAMGIGMGLGALHVRFRDIGYVLPFLMQMWMFATPVVYPTSLVPEAWRWVFALNPMTGLIQGLRDAVLGRPLDLPILALSTGMGLLLAWLGVRLFTRLERRVADLI